MIDNDPAPTPPLEIMKALLDAERLKLGVHIRKMNSPGSPVYQAGENIWPASLILVGSFAGTALVHYYLGGAILAVGCWWWLTKVQPKVKDGVFERTSGWVLHSDVHFDTLWAKGLISLFVQMPDGRQFAATRRDDWRSFVRMVAQEYNAMPTKDAA